MDNPCTVTVSIPQHLQETAIAVYCLGSLGHGGPTPLNLTIAGAVLTALLSSITTGVLILSDRLCDVPVHKMFYI
ncbi:hypothetical protein [Nostoc sp.]|uniref:hypothetical protein n=1 Tax=Nostoc sp. TaxID=1180 RepID=UPI003FA57F0D